MIKKENKKAGARTGAGTKTIGIMQIILLVSTSFAISFLLSDNFVSADAGLAVAGGLAGGAVVGTAVAIGAPSLTLTAGGTVLGNLFGGTLFSTTAIGYEGSITALPGAGAVNAIVTAAIYAIVWVAAAYIIVAVFGLDKDVQRALVPAAAMGGATMGALTSISAYMTATGSTTSIFVMSGWATLGWGLAVAAVMFVLTYKKISTQTIKFNCLPWEAPKGGAKCEECNKNPYISCSEYRCKSLGQQCEFRTAGVGAGNGICVSVGRNDTLAPEISPWEGALSPQELSYTGFGVRPPSLGIKITDSRTTSGCIQAYSKLQFGLSTKEPAKCIMSWNNTFTEGNTGPMLFDELTFPTYNHTVRTKLPNQAINGTDFSPLLQSDGTFTLFVRCEDVAGNYNVDSYAVNFCVDKSPDTRAPVIEDTSIKSGSPIAFGVDEAPLFIFTDELAQCKWSRQNQAYATMENSFTCANDPTEINANLQYACLTTLTGIENGKENKFYFGCNDSLGNVMPLNKEFILVGSQKLSISDVKPETGTEIRGGSNVVLVDIEVKTSAGAENGKAICSYRSLDYSPIQYQPMLNTGTSDTSKQEGLLLPAGKYTYDIKCVDFGGNAIEESTTFEVLSDKEAPKVSRVYKQEPDALKITTNEDAQCVYAIDDCNYLFDDATKMTYANANTEKNHIVAWETGKTYYIKCRDDFGNEPDANDCSIIAKTI